MTNSVIVAVQAGFPARSVTLRRSAARETYARYSPPGARRPRDRRGGPGCGHGQRAISRLLARNADDGDLGALSPREREVLELMAEGRSNAAIAQRMVITERAVAKHTSSIFIKLGLQPSDDDNRRVLAVLAYLGR
jgi:DNA-binding NarL/FixJ family response regulator